MLSSDDESSVDDNLSHLYQSLQLSFGVSGDDVEIILEPNSMYNKILVSCLSSYATYNMIAPSTASWYYISQV